MGHKRIFLFHLRFSRNEIKHRMIITQYMSSHTHPDFMCTADSMTPKNPNSALLQVYTRSKRSTGPILLELKVQ